MDWSGICTADNIHKATGAFTEQVQIIADKHAPRVTVRVKGALNNIFSDELLALMKERDAAKVKAARTKKVDDWNEFKRLRNKVNFTKLVEKRNYYSETLNETKGNPKQMWRKLKELVPTKNKKSSDTQRIKIQDKEVTDSRKIAHVLNDYFINIGRTLAEKPTSTISILRCNINTTNTFRLQLIQC